MSKRKRNASQSHGQAAQKLLGAGLGLSKTQANTAVGIITGSTEENPAYTTADRRLRKQLGKWKKVIHLPCNRSQEVNPKLHYASLDVQMQAKLESSRGFEDLLVQAIDACGEAGLTAVLYVDEAIPGNIIAPDNHRRAFLWYCSIAELQGGISSAYCWCVLNVIRKETVDCVSGGLATVMTALLDCMRPELDGFAIRTRQGDHKLVKFSRLFFLADEAALRSSLAIKGACGMRPCFRCMNCIALEHPNVPGYYAIDHAHFADFRLCDSERVRAVISELRKFEAHATKLKEAQTLLGWYLQDRSLPCRTDLWTILPLDHCLFDSTHCLHSCGVVCQEIGLFLQSCEQRLKFHNDDLMAFASASWQSVTAWATAKSVLNAKLVRYDGGDYKGNATQTKMALSLLTYLGGKLLTNGLPLEVASLRTLHAACTLLDEIKQSPTESKLQELDQLFERHQQQFVACYGREAIRPKHHYVRHVPQQVKSVGRHLDTLTTERKHKAFKLKVAPLLSRLEDFDETALAHLVENDLLETQRELSLEPTLQQAHLACDLCVQWPGSVVHEAKGAQVDGCNFKAGFYLSGGSDALYVERFLSIDEKQFMVEAQKLHCLERNANWSSWHPDKKELAYFSLLEIRNWRRPVWSLTDNKSILLLR